MSDLGRPDRKAQGRQAACQPRQHRLHLGCRLRRQRLQPLVRESQDRRPARPPGDFAAGDRGDRLRRPVARLEQRLCRRGCCPAQRAVHLLLPGAHLLRRHHRGTMRAAPVWLLIAAAFAGTPASANGRTPHSSAACESTSSRRVRTTRPGLRAGPACTARGPGYVGQLSQRLHVAARPADTGGKSPVR